MKGYTILNWYEFDKVSLSPTKMSTHKLLSVKVKNFTNDIYYIKNI